MKSKWTFKIAVLVYFSLSHTHIQSEGVSLCIAYSRKNVSDVNLYNSWLSPHICNCQGNKF